MRQIKIGDTIKHKNNTTFSNGAYTNTVERIEVGVIYNKIWMKETGTFIDERHVEVVFTEKSVVINKLIEERSELLNKAKQLTDKADEITKAINLIEELK